MSTPRFPTRGAGTIMAARGLTGPTISRPDGQGGGGGGGGCSGGSCSVGGRRGKVRTRPYGVATTLSLVGPTTLTLANFPNKIPSGAKLRLDGMVGAGASVVTSITVDNNALNLGPVGIPAKPLDLQATAGVPADLILPRIETSLTVVVTCAIANVPVTAYLENVPLEAVAGCSVPDDGADATS